MFLQMLLLQVSLSIVVLLGVYGGLEILDLFRFHIVRYVMFQFKNIINF